MSDIKFIYAKILQEREYRTQEQSKSTYGWLENEFRPILGRATARSMDFKHQRATETTEKVIVRIQYRRGASYLGETNFLNLEKPLFQSEN